MKIYSINAFNQSKKNVGLNQKNSNNFGAKIPNLSAFIEKFSKKTCSSTEKTLEVVKEITEAGCKNSIFDFGVSKDYFIQSITMNSSEVGNITKFDYLGFPNFKKTIDRLEKEAISDILLKAAGQAKLKIAANDLKARYPELISYIDQTASHNVLKKLDSDKAFEFAELAKKQEAYKEKHPILSKLFGMPKK